MVPDDNLEKQIKRHVIGRRQSFYCTVAPGLEAVCARELSELSDSLHVDAIDRGGVSFSGRLEDLYRANLHLRTAGRVLMRLDDFKATNFRQLAKRAAAFGWKRYLPRGAVPVCKVSTHQSRLYHSEAVAARIGQAIQAYWETQDVVPAGAHDQTLYVRLDNDRVSLSLDSSGPNLYRRGFKTHAAAAPLRETAAAAILDLAGYDPRRPLLDPMCGAGTFSLEAALIAKKVAPGALRTFAFMQWPAFRPRQWAFLKAAAAKERHTLASPLIFASDTDPEAVRHLSDCVQRHGLEDAIQVTCCDFFTRTPPSDTAGLIVINPPYGRRLEPDSVPHGFYSRIGTKLATDFRGWQVALLVPHPELITRLPAGLEPLRLIHGGLPLTLLVGVL